LHSCLAASPALRPQRRRDDRTSVATAIVWSHATRATAAAAAGGLQTQRFAGYVGAGLTWARETRSGGSAQRRSLIPTGLGHRITVARRAAPVGDAPCVVEGSHVSRDAIRMMRRRQGADVASSDGEVRGRLPSVRTAVDAVLTQVKSETITLLVGSRGWQHNRPRRALVGVRTRRVVHKTSWTPTPSYRIYRPATPR
jgi:hypothetical protein